MDWDSLLDRLNEMTLLKRGVLWYNKRIKYIKMRYINAIFGSLMFCVLFILGILFIPKARPLDGVTIILTISTFLFAIFSGFFISRLNGRYDKIDDIISVEDSYWISFYRTAGLLGKDFQKKVAENMDKYYIVAYDFPDVDYYKSNAKHINDIYNDLAKIKKGNESNVIYDHLISYLSSIEECRKKTAVYVLERMTTGQWVVLILLSIIIIFSMYYIRTASMYSDTVTVILSTSLILVLLTLRDLQNRMLLGKKVLTESGQEVFDMMGKERYYNKHELAINHTVVPKDIKKYRLGLHKPGENPRIKNVKV